MSGLPPFVPSDGLPELVARAQAAGYPTLSRWVDALERGTGRIPRLLHRTVAARTDEQVEAWWDHWRLQVVPSWQHITWREPLDLALFPLTAKALDAAQNGAQRGGLVRLEVLWHEGGVYVDSDVQGYRSLEPLLGCRAFACWEDRWVAPDAVLGAVPEHPAIRECITLATALVLAGADAWKSGPGVTTAVLPGRDDVLMLPPGAWYPYHYTEMWRQDEPHWEEQPWAFGAHHWRGSWLDEGQRRELDGRRARARKAAKR